MAARVLKPSLKQSRVSSPERPVKPPNAAQKAKPLPSASSSSASSSSPPSSSSLTKDRLLNNLQYYQFLTRVQSLLITTPASSPSTLSRASLVLRPCDFQEVLVERSHSSLCALPTCAHSTQRSAGRYRLSLSQQRVWDVSEEVTYCSRECEESSLDYLALLQDDPVYLRRFGELMAAMRERGMEQQQGRVVEALHALPVAPGHADPAGAPDERPALVVRENAETSAQPLRAGSGAAIEGYDRGTSDKAQPRSAMSKAARPFRPTSSPSHLPSPSISNAVTGSFGGPSVLAVSPAAASSQPELSHEELDSIALVALQESAKRRVRMNPIDSSSFPTDGDDDDPNEPLQSEEETRQQLAAMRTTRVLSPFAEVLRALTHWAGEDTSALLAEKGRLREVNPARQGDARRRQVALTEILHRELRALSGALGLTPLPLLQAQVDAVALTFVLNEHVPGLSSAQWQLVLVVVLLALQRAGKAEGWRSTEEAAIALAKTAGFERAQLEALVDVVVPFPPPLPTQPPPPPSSALATKVSPSTTPSLAPAAPVFVLPLSLTALPRDVVSSVLSYLAPTDLLTASTLSSLLHVLAHPLSSSDLPLLAHDSALLAGRMHTLGYRDGVTAGRDVLMQRAFDRALPFSYACAIQRDAVNGVVAALAMWSSRHGSPGDDQLWARCDEVNAAVMRRPGGRGQVAVQEDAERVGKEVDEPSLEHLCLDRLQKAGVDGSALLSALKKGLGEVHEAAAEDVDALVRAHAGGSTAVLSSPPGHALRNPEEDAEDFM